jgi:uncharacterized membrane protein YgdD (TMEM256/DUF423 family)
MRIWLIIGALNGAWAVVFGALGAHMLDPALPAETRTMFETAVHYQLLHALALIGVAAISPRIDLGFARTALMISGFCFSLGILLFCGGLYALSAYGIALGSKLAPFGGTLLIVGWLALALAGVARRDRQR